MSKSFKDFINEASVGGGDLYNASKKVIQFIAKSLAKTYTDVDGQTYSNATGSYFGYLYISPDDGSAIRVNWDSNEFHSINYWDDYAEESKPTMEILVKNVGPTDRSFAKILPEIVEFIKGENTANEMDESTRLNEARFEPVEYKDKIYNDRVELVWDLYNEGLSLDQISQMAECSNARARDIIKQKKAENGEVSSSSGKVRVISGVPETIVPSSSAKAAQKVLEETEYADPETVFDELDSLSSLVGRGYMTALLITGQGGIGKSYGVTNVLKDYGSKGKEWVVMKGHCTASAMYKFLYNHYNQICVFDDCDSIFDTADGMNVLKGALDSGAERELSWMTKGSDVVDTFGCETHEEVEQALAEWSAENNGRDGTPSYFKFEGAVIFISNLNKKDIYKKDRALLSRCTCIDIVLRAQDVLNRIKTVLPSIKIYKALGPKNSRDITDEELKKEVFEYINSDEFKNNPKMRGKEVNFRLFNQVYLYRHAELPNWKELAVRAGG